jgi:hypothetical protein
MICLISRAALRYEGIILSPVWGTEYGATGIYLYYFWWTH